MKTKQKFPAGDFSETDTRFAAFDGDADRILYFYNDANSGFRLLDGDKIAALMAKQLNDWLKEAGLEKVNLGVVQTAYANGASTSFLNQNVGQEKVSCAKTGVKHLHARAHMFDIGVYFEANGHGTVTFKPDVEEKIRQSGREKLIHFVDLINQTVGDAFSLLLCVEICLAFNNMSVKDWASMYCELPNRLCKVLVEDRTKIVTFDEERKVSEPKGLQEAIDKTVAEFENGRSFVRPSGTEDAVRVYAEAATQKQCDELARKVARLVHELGGGKGELPENIF